VSAHWGLRKKEALQGRKNWTGHGKKRGKVRGENGCWELSDGWNNNEPAIVEKGGSLTTRGKERLSDKENPGEKK